MYTKEDILAKLNKRVDYSEVARLLELDLNTIAEETLDDFLGFKVFFDYGDYDTTVNGYAPGEGAGFQEIPILLSLISGDYTTLKGPEVFSLMFRIEGFGFEERFEDTRKVFEIYSSLHQGTASNEGFGEVLYTTFTDFPVLTEAFPYKGAQRFQIFLSLNINFIYVGELSNSVSYTLDGDPINLLGLVISRNRVLESVQRNLQTETTNLASAQNITFSATMIFDGSDAAKIVKDNIKNLDTEMNTIMEFKIIYSDDEDTYDIIISDGEIDITEGSYVNMSFTMVLTDGE